MGTKGIKLFLWRPSAAVDVSLFGQEKMSILFNAIQKPLQNLTF